MLRRGPSVALLLAVLLAWNTQPVRDFRRHVSAALQSGADTITGKTAAGVGMMAKRDVLQGNLINAIDEYRGLKGAQPRSAQDLADAGLLQKPDMRDEWGREVVFEMHGSALVVRSLGPDGKPGTDDDWTIGD